MRIEEGTKFDYIDVLIRPKRSTLTSRKDVDLMRTFTFLHSQRTWTGIPIATANMHSCGTFEMAKILVPHKMLTCLHKFYTIEELKNFFETFEEPDYVAYTTGIRNEDIAKLDAVLAAGLGNKFNFVVIDVPNAYLERFVEVLQDVRKKCPQHTIIAGNVATNEITEELILKGADIVKLGIGPGSACTTRRQTGVGYPQLSAVIECSDAAHGLNGKNKGYGLVMADGGLAYPSCVAKAFCGGADFVMSGSLFSGYEQSGGKTIVRDGKKYKQYLGSSSNEAMRQNYGKIDEHRASEGRELELPHKGDINNFLQELLGSLRSTGTYIGAKHLKEFSKRATFIKVNRQLNTIYEQFDTVSHTK